MKASRASYDLQLSDIRHVFSEKSFRSLGSVVKPAYQPQVLVDNPPHPTDITLELLLASQSHLGHATSLWNPRNSRYIFGVREGIHIISLDVTAAYLRRACKVVEEVAHRGGLILFVGTRKGQDTCVINAARLAKGYHIFQRWVPGTLTNGQQIIGHCGMKVVDSFDRELPHLQEHLVDKPVLKPDLVVCFNPLENEACLHECGLNNIPTIGVIDTDADATWVTYPIPANDDSLRCIQVIAGVLGRAGQDGQRRRMEETRKGKLPFQRIKPEELYRKEVQSGSDESESQDAPVRAPPSPNSIVEESASPGSSDGRRPIQTEKEAFAQDEDESDYEYENDYGDEDEEEGEEMEIEDFENEEEEEEVYDVPRGR